MGSEGGGHQPRDLGSVTLILAQQFPHRPKETRLEIPKDLCRYILSNDSSGLVGNIYLNILLDSCTNSLFDVCAKERLPQP